MVAMALLLLFLLPLLLLLMLLSHRPVGDLYVLYLGRLPHHAVSVRARLDTHQLRRGNHPMMTW